MDSISDLKTDEAKFSMNKEVVSMMGQLLQIDSSFYYRFDSLKIGKIYSADSLLRIYSWNIPLARGYHKYFCFLQTRDSITGDIVTRQLIDNRLLDTTIITDSNWYGALYYDIVLREYKGRKYYTLLGLDINNLFTSKKIIDVLTFDENGNINLGMPLFFKDKNWHNRLVFEYNARVTMTLRYNKLLDMIVLDHLSPRELKYTGIYEYYGPDFTFDGFYWYFGRWIIKEDIDVRIQ